MRTHTIAMALALSIASRAAVAFSSTATPGPVQSTPASRSYEDARHSYYALKANAGKGHGREAWLGAAARFEQVAHSYPQSERAPLALYTAAELHNQLSRASLSSADRDLARRDYDQVARLYPRSSLADDSLYQLARIAVDRENDPVHARTVLVDLLARYPHGDTAVRARRLLVSLPEAHPRAKMALAKTESSHDAPLAPSDSAPATPNGQHPSAHPPASDEDDDDDQGPATADDALQETKGESADAAPEPVASPPAAEVSKHHTPGNWHGILEALRRIGPSPGGVPLAVQMGLRVRRVVIDAGHGGHDSGAIGPDGTLEKDVTLAIAQKLAQDLKAQGLEVLLTRNDDRFVALEDRAAFANRMKSDLFISIHCNAARDRKLRGTETYFLNVTDDRYALRLAARENQASEKSISDLQMILADLATKADVEESDRLARSIQHRLAEGSHDPARRDLGVKHALFYVLLGTKMPSVLVETAFLSNPDDAKKLRSDRYQGEVAHAISQGVSQFLDQRRSLADAVP